MSQENVEIVRRGYEAFAEGDIETVLRLLDPDITLQEGEQTLDTPSVYHGHQGLLEMVARVLEGLEDVSYTPERFVDVGDQVLVDVRRKGRGSLSGVPVERWQFHVWEIAKGRVTAFRTYGDRQEALKAAGLSEWAMSQENVEIVRDAVVASTRSEAGRSHGAASTSPTTPTAARPVLAGTADKDGGLFAVYALRLGSRDSDATRHPGAAP